MNREKQEKGAQKHNLSLKDLQRISGIFIQQTTQAWKT